MGRHGISNGTVDARAPPAATAAAVASGSPDRAPAVTLDGKPNNRNAAAARAAVAGTVYSNLDAGRAFPKNLPNNRRRAGPRAGRSPILQRPWLWPPLRWLPLLRWQPSPPPRRRLAGHVAVPGNAGSAPAAAVARSESPGSAAPPASAARPGPPPGRTGCNTGRGGATVGSASHTPSADKGAHTCRGNLDRPCRLGHTPVGPREWLLPKVKPRRRGSTRLRGVVISTLDSA